MASREAINESIQANQWQSIAPVASRDGILGRPLCTELEHGDERREALGARVVERRLAFGVDRAHRSAVLEKQLDALELLVEGGGDERRPSGGGLQVDPGAVFEQHLDALMLASVRGHVQRRLTETVLVIDVGASARRGENFTNDLSTAVHGRVKQLLASGLRVERSLIPIGGGRRHEMGAGSFTLRGTRSVTGHASLKHGRTEKETERNLRRSFSGEPRRFIRRSFWGRVEKFGRRRGRNLSSPPTFVSIFYKVGCNSLQMLTAGLAAVRHSLLRTGDDEDGVVAALRLGIRRLRTGEAEGNDVDDSEVDHSLPRGTTAFRGAGHASLGAVGDMASSINATAQSLRSSGAATPFHSTSSLPAIADVPPLAGSSNAGSSEMHASQCALEPIQSASVGALSAPFHKRRIEHPKARPPRRTTCSMLVWVAGVVLVLVAFGGGLLVADVTIPRGCAADGAQCGGLFWIGPRDCCDYAYATSCHKIDVWRSICRFNPPSSPPPPPLPPFLPPSLPPSLPPASPPPPPRSPPPMNNEPSACVAGVGNNVCFAPHEQVT